MRSASPLLLAAAGFAMLTGWVASRPAEPVEPVVHGEVSADRFERRAADGFLLLDGVPFTGAAIAVHADGGLAERTAYVGGRREGPSEQWTPDGTRSAYATYAAGRREGVARTWWPDGTLHSEARYADGVAHGVQREWYRSGAPFKELRLTAGREDGLQRAWRENGKLFANYEARDGRIYGLKRATLCFELEDEVLDVTRDRP